MTGLRERAEHLDVAATFTSVSARAFAARSTLPVTTTALSTGFSGQITASAPYMEPAQPPLQPALHQHPNLLKKSTALKWNLQPDPENLLK